MKHIIFLLLLSLFLHSCDTSDDSPAEGATNEVNEISFIYNGERVVLDHFYMNNIKNISTQEVIGRRLTGYSYFPNDKWNKNYEFSFFFYTTGNQFRLFGVETGITEKDPPNSQALAFTNFYNNLFDNEPDLTFTHNIENINDTLIGTFEGKLVDHGLYDTISIQQGRVKFLIPEN